jgi:hypothetical protein
MTVEPRDSSTVLVELNDDVGISLMAGEETDAIVDLLAEQLGDQLRISDCVTYVKIETDVGQLEIQFSQVAEMLGRPFSLGEFQLIFSSYYGRPEVFEDMIGVYASMERGVTESDDRRDK